MHPSRRFAAAGITALVFDYRGFEASGGELRQRISPRDQTEDYRNALTWLSLQPEIDPERLGIRGTSFNGPHVIEVATHDPRVKAVVSQVGPMDLGQITRGLAGLEQFAGLQQLTIQERVSHRLRGCWSKYWSRASRPLTPSLDGNTIPQTLIRGG
jgi:predicted acyl esterase